MTETGNERSRPAGNGPASAALDTASVARSAHDRSQIATTAPRDVRRRWSEALRCEPMAGGGHDPLSAVRDGWHTGRRRGVGRQRFARTGGTITVREVGPHTRAFEGHDGAVLASLVALDVKYTRARTGGGWWVQASRAEDVSADLSLRGFTVQAVLG